MCTPTAATARLLQIVAVAAVGASKKSLELVADVVVTAQRSSKQFSEAKKARPARIVQNYGPQRIFRILSTQLVQFIKLLRASRGPC